MAWTELRKQSIRILVAAAFAAATLLLSGPSAVAAETLARVDLDNADMNMQTAGSSGCVVGEIAADALRTVTGADVAIVPTGDLHILRGGELTEESVERLFPEDKPVAVVSVTPARLCHLLEEGVAHVVLGEDEATDREASHFAGFPQISGMAVQCDVSSAVGFRVNRITVNGETLDTEDVTHWLTLAAPVDLLTGAYGYTPLETATETDWTLRSCFTQYARSCGTVTKPGDTGRLSLIGALDNQIISHIPLIYVGLALGVFLTISVARVRKKEADYYFLEHMDDDR